MRPGSRLVINSLAATGARVLRNVHVTEELYPMPTVGCVQGKDERSVVPDGKLPE